MTRVSGVAAFPDKEHDGLRRLDRSQQIECLPELMRTGLRRRVVERDDEVTHGSGSQPPIDSLPRLQIVRQRDRAKITSKRGADFGRSGQHGGNAGLDLDVEVSPMRIAALDGFKHRRRHRKHAGISAGYHRDLPAFGGERQRVTRALDLDAIVRGMTSLTGNGFRNSVEIGSIADQVTRGTNRSRGGWRQQLDRSGPETDNDERTAHSRLPWPGISTIEK